MITNSVNPIRKRREKKRLSQSDLALLVGVSQPTISQFEIGGVIPSEAQIRKITEILGIGPGTLNKELHQFYEARIKELKKRIEGNRGMPEYRCKDCGAIWHGWGYEKGCPKCGGKLEIVPENDATEK